MGQINRIIGELVQAGLIDDQNFATSRLSNGLREVRFDGAEEITIALKDLPYSDVYRSFIKNRTYNVLMFDGGMMQIMYTFRRSTLLRHRLAYFPKPGVEEQYVPSDTDVRDAIYEEFIEENTLPCAFRFDYDADTDRHKLVNHPKGHLSIGQFDDCRIPTTGPLTPGQFFDFILRNFYHRAFQRYRPSVPGGSRAFPEDIHAEERRIVHISLPHS